MIRQTSIRLPEFSRESPAFRLFVKVCIPSVATMIQNCAFQQRIFRTVPQLRSSLLYLFYFQDEQQSAA